MMRIAIIWLSRISLLVLTGIATVATLNSDAFGVNELVSRHPDKITHAIAAFVFSVFALLALPNIRAWMIFLALVALSGMAEVMQIFGGRSAHMSDLASSWLGIAPAAATYYAPWLRSTKLRADRK